MAAMQEALFLGGTHYCQLRQAVRQGESCLLRDSDTMRHATEATPRVCCAACRTEAAAHLYVAPFEIGILLPSSYVRGQNVARNFARNAAQRKPRQRHGVPPFPCELPILGLRDMPPPSHQELMAKGLYIQCEEDFEPMEIGTYAAILRRKQVGRPWERCVLLRIDEGNFEVWDAASTKQMIYSLLLVCAELS
eukprot:6194438-Pleurochrysis_carterae.AAC.1